jgi:hypothetical protein
MKFNSKYFLFFSPRLDFGYELKPNCLASVAHAVIFKALR